MSISIVGDFGGTNARLAVSTPNSTIENIQEYRCADYREPSDIIKAYIDSSKIDNVEDAVFAVAGASEDPEHIIFTNGPWAQRAVDFTNAPIKSVTTINDFEAICYSISALKPEDTKRIVAGKKPFYPSAVLQNDTTYKENSTRLLQSKPERRFVTIDPGTGLGVSSGLVTNSGQFLVIGGEGGHADFSPSTDEELELKEHLESMDTIVTLETIASGTGLVTTFNARCDILDLPSRINNAAELKEQMGQGKPKEVRAAARWTLGLFARTLGKCAASTTLTTDSRTVFIAGGVLPKLGKDFYVNAFTSAFHNNDLGENNTLQATPVALITHKQPGLLGASAYLSLSRN